MARRTKYLTLAEELEQEIVAGRHVVGQRFTSERDLVKRSGLSLLTVRQALSRLERRGLVLRRQGAGTFVKSREPREERVWLAVVVMEFSAEMSAGYHFIYSAWMQGVHRVADKAGAQLSIVDFGIVKDPPERMREMMEQDNGPSGYLFARVDPWMMEWLVEKEGRAPKPHVVVADRKADKRLNVVTVDREGASARAARRFCELGHKRMAFVGSDGNDRLEGWVRGLKEAGLFEQNRDLIVFDAEPSSVLLVAEKNGYTAGLTLLRRKDRPTAIFCMNDSRAKGVLSAARELGITVPGQLSVLGFDNMPGVERLTPPLATFAPPWEEVGEAAARSLMSWIKKGKRFKPRFRVFEAALVERESLGSAPAAVREAAL